MKVAGRFKPCVHMGCFDLEVFVEMNQRSRKASNQAFPFSIFLCLCALGGKEVVFSYFVYLNKLCAVISVAVPHLSKKLCTGECHYRPIFQSRHNHGAPHVKLMELPISLISIEQIYYLENVFISDASLW